MNKFFYALAALYLSINSSYAQDKRCGTDEVHKMKMESDPQYRAWHEDLVKDMQEWSSQDAGQRTAGATTINIPVVVHIVHNSSAQNLADNVVRSQIDVLNEDFNALNHDLSSNPAAFQSKIGTGDIHFCLATRKPNGDWTNGIERRQTSITTFTLADSRLKHYSQGGLDAWDKNKYLNIWVCNMDGYLGYTEGPGSAADVDGVMIKYSAFGRLGFVLDPNYNKGRTATHEVGHWLGLSHIWGSDGGTCAGSDNISDTPNQAQYTTGCRTFPATDACTTVSPGVMFMNYMDYSIDGCMHMFTVGQVNAMRNILNSSTYRLIIQSSNGCTAPTGFSEINAESFINLYPNPAHDAIHVDVLLPAMSFNAIVLDVIGKKLISSEAHNRGEQSFNLDVSALKPGLYTLILNTDRGAVVKRFSINR